MNTFDYHSPSAYLILKHKINFKQSNTIIESWLTEHPRETRKTLSELLSSNKVIYKNDRLWSLPQLALENAKFLVEEIQNSSTLEIKDRWYKLKQYPQCFIGSELVDWLKQNKELLLEEAIAVGQSLLDHNLIQHVCDDHEFKNDFLFYRFKA